MRFQDALAELASQERPSNIDPRLWEAQRQAAQIQMEELRAQVEAYERLGMTLNGGSGSPPITQLATGKAKRT